MEQRFLVVYSDTYRKKCVEVYFSRSKYLVMIDVLKRDSNSVIYKIRELYNPIRDQSSVITASEYSMLKQGIYSKTNKNNMSLSEYNSIAQIYGMKLLKKSEYAG